MGHMRPELSVLRTQQLAASYLILSGGSLLWNHAQCSRVLERVRSICKRRKRVRTDDVTEFHSEKEFIRTFRVSRRVFALLRAQVDLFLY